MIEKHSGLWQYIRTVIVIAHNIRSLHNVGAILRNAAAFGVARVYLTGYTGVPPRKEIAKVSLGAEDLVCWEQSAVEDAIARCRADGYTVVGLETGEGAVDIRSFATEKIALVLGSEVEGIPADVRAMLDALVEIPMDKKRSLNVSVASGVAMFVLSLRP